MRAWDPIGVQDEPLALDEYDTYARVLVGKLKQHATFDTAERS